MPLLEQSENEIYLIKSNQSFGIQVLQQKHLPVIEETLFEITGIKRAVRFVLDETISNVALPYMAGTFSVSHNESTWILTFYLIAVD